MSSAPTAAWKWREGVPLYSVRRGRDDFPLMVGALTENMNSRGSFQVSEFLDLHQHPQAPTIPKAAPYFPRPPELSLLATNVVTADSRTIAPERWAPSTASGATPAPGAPVKARFAQKVITESRTWTRIFRLRFGCR